MSPDIEQLEPIVPLFVVCAASLLVLIGALIIASNKKGSSAKSRLALGMAFGALALPVLVGIVMWRAGLPEFEAAAQQKAMQLAAAIFSHLMVSQALSLWLVPATALAGVVAFLATERASQTRPWAALVAGVSLSLLGWSAWRYASDVFTAFGVVAMMDPSEKASLLIGGLDEAARPFDVMAQVAMAGLAVAAAVAFVARPSNAESDAGEAPSPWPSTVLLLLAGVGLYAEAWPYAQEHWAPKMPFSASSRSRATRGLRRWRNEWSTRADRARR